VRDIRKKVLRTLPHEAHSGRSKRSRMPFKRGRRACTNDLTDLKH
jgi:hypothetical protein